MKLSMVTFFCLFLFKLCPAQVTWYTQNSGTNYPLNGVYFVDANNGWVSGWIGILLHTTDGGETWGLQNTPANYGLYSVFFTDLQNGWAAGYGGDVVHTTNGGNTWTSQSIGSYDDIYKLFFIDGNNGWAVGGYYDIQTGFYARAIYHTTNGGNNWSLQYGMSYETELYSVHFPDSNTGYAAGASGAIMKTTNGGTNWSVIQNMTSFDFSDIFFTNSTTGFAAGEYLGVPHYSVIFKTTDGGTNWTQITLAYNEALAGIYFPDLLNGWAVGNNYGSGNSGVIYYTSDGGDNWTYQNTPAINALSKVFFVNNTTGWAVGTLGTIVATENPIPVELVSFSASVNKSNVDLYWQTASETNNKGFEILRSLNNVTEQKNWTKIGFVEGSGTSSEENTYTFTDKNLEAGSYSYKLVEIDFTGTRNDLKIATAEVNSSPAEYVLEQNYPNPFNPTTIINYQLGMDNLVVLKVYNMLGQEVATLVNEYKPAGRYNVQFTINNEQLSSGVYFYKLTAGSYTAVKKMILLK
jgi:photosystem II stability/assembly factor-like uncharacterized protein